MRFFVLFFLTWTSAALSQTYPQHQNTSVNDFAGLLSQPDEAALSAQIDQLRRETGVEMTILTLASLDQYSRHQSLEQYATGLFNHWGIGSSARDDGVLVMVVRDDRAMRIELGAGYTRDWDLAAQRIIDNHFVPAFAAGDYPRGLKNGTTAVIDEIVIPFHRGENRPAEAGKDTSGIWIFGLFAALVALINGRHLINDGLVRFRTCPKCGRRYLRQSRRVTLPASTTSSGAGIRRRECLNCDYIEEFSYSISPVSSSSRSGFGGGRSGGGGASGRW